MSFPPGMFTKTARMGCNASIQYPKRLRAQGSDNFEIQQLIIEKQQDEFMTINVSINDESRITAYYSLSKRIKELKRNLTKYDLLDCFTIVYPVLTSTGEITPDLERVDSNVLSFDLFTEYPNITIDDVANSCRFYGSYTHERHLFDQDLNLSLLYFENNVEQDLYSRVHSEMLRNYDIDYHGGPLFLIIMLKQLSTSNETSKSNIVDIIDTYNIKTSCVGEYITDVVDLVQPLVDTLCTLTKNAFPELFIDKVVTIFTTTSVHSFNELFLDLKKTIIATRIQSSIVSTIKPFDSSLSNDLSSIKWVLKYALVAYKEMVCNGTWDKYIPDNHRFDSARPTSTSVPWHPWQSSSSIPFSQASSSSSTSSNREFPPLPAIPPSSPHPDTKFLKQILQPKQEPSTVAPTLPTIPKQEPSVIEGATTTPVPFVLRRSLRGPKPIDRLNLLNSGCYSAYAIS